jgi:hypothetical protein
VIHPDIHTASRVGWHAHDGHLLMDEKKLESGRLIKEDHHVRHETSTCNDDLAATGSDALGRLYREYLEVIG